MARPVLPVDGENPFGNKLRAGIYDVSDRADAAISGLGGKAATVHTHAESDITNLVSDLAGKAPTVHTHAESDITNLVSDLAGKAPTVHTHAQSDVTNLVSDLASKALRVAPLRTVTASTTLALGDASGFIVVDSASAASVTIPPFSSVAFTAGSKVEVIFIGVGAATIVDNTTGTPATISTPAQNEVSRILCIAQDSWLLY